ncbi:serine/arginine-rich splicing factor SC35-like [Magnolia sinica]|uniref:serine/arginine-rich splicing factor SC35-like n=1 Tax=Magnolia sinica TaxID=86752 RepID=UPI00265AC775|nr:serine/arginine-rich splicing factor SC35-like [Magnolia sinica]
MEEGERESRWEQVSSRRNRIRQPPFTIFVANLTFDTSEDDLIWIFNRYGKLVGVHLPRDHVRRRSKGYAFVTFYYEQEAYNVANYLHGRRIDGRIVSLAWAKSSREKGSRGRRPSSGRNQRTAPARYQRADTQKSYAAATRAFHPSGKTTPIPSETRPLDECAKPIIIEIDPQQVD